VCVCVCVWVDYKRMLIASSVTNHSKAVALKKYTGTKECGCLGEETDGGEKETGRKRARRWGGGVVWADYV